MIDLRGRYNLVWDSVLQPVGEGTGEKEPFDTWWERNAVRLGSLHSRIAEQWVHRHWQNSPFCHLDLNRISWRLEWDAVRDYKVTGSNSYSKMVVRYRQGSPDL